MSPCPSFASRMVCGATRRHSVATDRLGRSQPEMTMPRQTLLSRKKRGPPATGKGELIGVRLQRPQMAAIDAWIAEQPDPKPSRPEAIRRLVEQSLLPSQKRKR